MNDYKARLEDLRKQALAAVTSFGGEPEGVEKTASHDPPDDTAMVLDDLDQAIEYLRNGGEIIKVAMHDAGSRPAVSVPPMTGNRIGGTNPLGGARTKEKQRPLQSTPGGSPTLVHNAEGKDQPSKTAALRDRLLAQFNVDSDDAMAANASTVAGVGGGAASGEAEKTASTDDGEKRGPTNPISRALTNPVAGAVLGGLNGLVGAHMRGKNPLTSSLIGAGGGAIGTALMRTLHGRAEEGRANNMGVGMSEKEKARILRTADQLRKQAGYDFPGGVPVYEGKAGPTLSAPGTELISSNDRAAAYTKRDAKRIVVPSLSQVLQEPAHSKATDPVAHKALSNASEAGVKTAGLAAGSIASMLRGGA